MLRIVKRNARHIPIVVIGLTTIPCSTLIHVGYQIIKLLLNLHHHVNHLLCVHGALEFVKVKRKLEVSSLI